MPRRATPLTARQVATKPEGAHADGDGLHLIVSATGMRTWEFRYSFGGKRRYMGLGSIDKWTLATARDHARELQKKVRRGVDPIEERRQGRKEATASTELPTFRQCAETVIAKGRRVWESERHAVQWEQSLEKHVYPVIGPKPIRDITVKDVLMVLEPIWTEIPETASRIRNRIKIIIEWAIAMDYRSEDVANPALWNNRLKVLLGSPKMAASKKRTKLNQPENFRALPVEEAPKFVCWLQSQTSIAAAALEFTILNANRGINAREARWDEIDFDNKLWTIPASKMKNRKEHKVPLSDRSIEILLRQKANNYQQSDYVFPGSRGHAMSDNTMRKFLERNGYVGTLTTHGFRTTFRQWCAKQKTRFSWNAAEIALAHTIGGVAGIYQRDDLLDERREIADAWSDYLYPVGTVVPFKRAV